MLKICQRVRVTRERDVVLPEAQIAKDSVLVSYSREHLVSFDLGSLRERWRVPAENFELLDVTETRLLTHWGGAHLRVFTLDGALCWERDFEPDVVARWDGHLVVIGSTLQILNLETGALEDTLDWPVQTFGGARINGDLVLVDSGRRGRNGFIEDPVRAYDLRRQAIVWERHLHKELQERHGFSSDDWLSLRGSVAAEDPLLAWVCQREVAVSAADGRLLWVAPFFGGDMPPVRFGQLVVGLIYDEVKKSVMRAVDVETGAMVYDVPLGETRRDLATFLMRPWGPVVFGSKLVLTSQSGWLIVVDGATGRVDSGEKVKSELYKPVAHEGRLYVTTNSGELLVFEESAQVKASKALATTKPAAVRSEVEEVPDLRATRAEAGGSSERELGATVVDELWSYLAQDWEANRDLLEKVTPGQRALVVAYHAVNEVALVTSLEDFLRSEAGEVAEEAVRALEALGLKPAARKLRAALGVFPSGVPKDVTTRARELAGVDAKGKKELFAEAEDALGELMEEDAFRLACARYVEQHPADFFNDGAVRVE